MNKTKAFTLLELLITLALAALVLLGAMRLYHGITRTLRVEQALTQVQETGRFTVSYLRKVISKAGDASCISKTHPIEPNAIHVYAENAVPSWLKKQAKKQTDILVIASCVNYKSRLQFKNTAYYVGDTKRKNHLGDKVYGFYSKIEGSRRVELAPGMDDLQLSGGARSVLARVGLVSEDHKLQKVWQVFVVGGSS